METTLERALSRAAAAHPGQAGVAALTDPLAALAVRVQLIRAAARTLDVQYYTWMGDTSGRILLHEVHCAAQRGVRVRLLLDDLGSLGIDPYIAALDTHANVEVRLFNPLVSRRLTLSTYLSDWRRMHRRMHNKSLTADGVATVVGGRNVGDKYFGGGAGGGFVDLDVVAIGSAPRQVVEDFSRYWQSDAVLPAARIVAPVADSQGDCLLAELADAWDQDAAQPYRRAVAEGGVVDHLLAGGERLVWAPVTLVSDEPAKGMGEDDGRRHTGRQLAEVLESPRQQLCLVSPYFIPTTTGLHLFRKLRNRGVRVRVLTNSLAANDSILAHGGYVGFRKALVKAGVELFEMGRRADLGLRRKRRRGVAGSRAASLHAKTFAVDDRLMFVGSFNFDPRSHQLNTEMGLLIESPRLAADLAAYFDKQVPASSFQVVLSKRGLLRWRGRLDGDEVIHRREPDCSAMRRLAARVAARLPIESWL